MNEPLSEVIRIRVTPSHAARLGEAAALSGLSLSNYIRRRLAPVTHVVAADGLLTGIPRLACEVIRHASGSFNAKRCSPCWWAPRY